MYKITKFVAVDTREDSTLGSTVNQRRIVSLKHATYENVPRQGTKSEGSERTSSGSEPRDHRVGAMDEVIQIKA